MSFVEKAEQLSDGLGSQNLEVTQHEHYELSWSGANPLRVIALALILGRGMSQYRFAIHMTSSYYSQVKFLLKRGRLFAAVECLRESMKHSDEAMRILPYAQGERRLPDMEVAGAPYFLLQKLPLVGRRWHLKAIDFLRMDFLYIEEILRRPGAERPDPIGAALVLSKLYALAGVVTYKNMVRIVELTRDHDKNQMLRIARHLGFQSLDKFYEFLVI